MTELPTDSGCGGQRSVVGPYFVTSRTTQGGENDNGCGDNSLIQMSMMSDIVSRTIIYQCIGHERTHDYLLGDGNNNGEVRRRIDKPHQFGNKARGVDKTTFNNHSNQPCVISSIRILYDRRE